MNAAILTPDELLAASILPLRAERPRDTARESTALDDLIGRINGAPDGALQALVETVAELCSAGSAGVSLLSGDAFVWPAIAGVWSPFLDQSRPAGAPPRGIVIDRTVTLLFDHPERIFPDLDAAPAAEEVLLVPLLLDGRAEGTLWAISHDERRFDAEDVRILERLALLAIAIEQTQRLEADRRHDRRSAQDRVRSTIRIIRALLRNADATVAGDGDGGQALVRLSSRIDAFAAGALGYGEDEGRDLWQLIAHLLQRHGEQPGERVVLDGPSVLIPLPAAGPLALALHELIENLFEHGALRRVGGRTAISWRVAPGPTGDVLDLEWRESGGIALVAPVPPVPGFGFELLEAGLPDLIGAETTIEVAPVGLSFSLRLALSPA